LGKQGEVVIDYIQINDKFKMHYACEEDAPWLEKILGKYDPYLNDRTNPSRFGVVFTENGVRLLWLGLSANSGKLLVTKAVTDPSIRNTGVLKEIGAAAIAWLQNNNTNDHKKLIIPVQQQFDCLFEDFSTGTPGEDGMRADIKVL